MALTRTYVHDEHTIVDSTGNEIVMFHKNTLADVMTGNKSRVSAVGKLMFSGTCGTAANVAAKTVPIEGFALVSGAHLTVRFTSGITVANATLNVNNTGAKPIMLNDAALPAGVILPNNQIILKYNGSSFDVVGGAGSTHVSKNNTKKFYFIGIDDANLSGTPSNEYFNTTVYVTASGNTLAAPYFEGDGSNLSNLNATQIKSGTLNAARLADSGVTPGSYGSSAAATLGFGDSFNIPYVTVDKYGRTTSIKNVALKMPANPDTDTKVTSNANNSAAFYLAGTTSSTTTTGTLVHNTTAYISGNTLYASAMNSPTLYLGSTSSYINASSYTGQANTVASISAHLEDGLSSTATNKAATANAARKLSTSVTALESTTQSHANSIASLNNTVSSLNSTLQSHGTSITSLSNDAADLRSLIQANQTAISNVSNNSQTANTAVGTLRSNTQTAFNSLISQLGTQATFSLSGTTLTITTTSSPSVTV